MRRIIAGFTLSLLILGVFAGIVGAQEGEVFALEELHLISWEYLPHGHPDHTGAVSSAILMAWHALRGYPRLLPDRTGDGRIDEDDTILLAQEFAEQMAPDGREGVGDAHVVDVLATYVGERHPDEFLLLIFDPTFSDEYLAWIGRSFDPGRYPGIEIILLDEPEYDTYANLLDEHRPGIVGWGYEPGENRFSVSRSRERGTGDQGGPVDLVNTDRGLLGPELIWETELRWGGDRWGFTSPEWAPFEIFIVLIPKDPDAASQPGDGDQPGDAPGSPPPGSSDGGSGDDPTPPPGGSDGDSGPGTSEPDPPPGRSSWAGDESSDLQIVLTNAGLEPFDPAQADPGEQVRYMLQVWHTGPDIPRNTVAELTVPFGVQIDWLGGNPAEMAGWPGRHFVWSIPDGSLQVANPALGMTPGVDVWLELLQITVAEGVCQTIELACETSSTTPDPNLQNNQGTLVEAFGPCGDGSDSGEQPAPSGLSNLWVTNMKGCWTWSGDGRERVIATVTGVVHNGGQADASGVQAQVVAGGVSTIAHVGTILAGGQETVSVTIDIGPYDGVSWPVPTSITADPSDSIREADESNNTTDSSFPESSDCG